MFWNHGLISLYFQANQAGSTSGMEFLGFKEVFTFLLGTGMIIKSFVSNRHTSIAKWMREDCPKQCEELGKPVVQHYFDIWHIGKSKLFYTMNNHNFTNETVKTNISKTSSITPLPSCLWPWIVLNTWRGKTIGNDTCNIPWASDELVFYDTQWKTALFLHLFLLPSLFVVGNYPASKSTGKKSYNSGYNFVVGWFTLGSSYKRLLCSVVSSTVFPKTMNGFHLQNHGIVRSLLENAFLSCDMRSMAADSVCSFQYNPRVLAGSSVFCAPLDRSRPMYRAIYRPTLDRYVDRHIYQHSADVSTEICRSAYRPIGRGIGRVSVDILSDYRPI